MSKEGTMAEQRDTMSPAEESQTPALEEIGFGSEDEKVFVASQWRLMWLHFKKHRMAVIGSIVVLLLYVVAALSSFISPYDKNVRFPNYINTPPQSVHFYDGQSFSLRPFVYGLIPKPDPETFSRSYEVDKSRKYYVRFFVPGSEYTLLGLIQTDVHLFGVDEGGTLFVLGTDELGRDLLSRVLAGATISLSIGLVGVISSFVLGSIIGGFSGFYGGVVDTVVQRVIELITSIPTIPLWMGLSAAVPRDWSPLQVYFAITLILSLRGWTRMARVVRGKLLELREYDFVMAARLSGTSDWRIITEHLLPLLMSYLIVTLTLAIPNMIMGETALSFLGLGLRPPVVSWGVLLQKAQNVRTVSVYPWLLTPAIFVILTVLAFNFMGDGLRDAADPYNL
jgi:peptide/nickel transport system permease protein